MNKERLLRLADFLEKEVPLEKFLIETWASGEPDACGTTACACGWATKIPEFAEAGLRLSLTHSFDIEGLPVLSGNIHYLNWDGFDATQHFFGISSQDSFYLFYSGTYPDDQKELSDVVARIRKFVSVQE